MAAKARTKLLTSRPARRSMGKVITSGPARQGVGGLLKGTRSAALSSNPLARRARRQTLRSGMRSAMPWRTTRRATPGRGLLGLLAAVAGVAVVARGVAGGGGRQVRNRLKGSAREAMGGGTHVPVSDQDLVQHVRTNVLGRERWRPFTVNVDAAGGTVTLRGQLDTEASINELERQVAELSGVERVENLLHLPGEPAPNIVDAEEASEAARLDASATRSARE